MNTTTRSTITRRHQDGFTLLEVLVSVVVLSIGLLGLAGLQASGLTNNNSSLQRTQATLLAYDMLDRMRANFDGVRAGHYDAITAGSETDPSSCFAVSTGCTVAEIAAFDNFDWGLKLGQLLPMGHGSVTGNGLNSNFTITVMWDDARTSASGTDCSGNSAVDLACLSISSQL